MRGINRIFHFVTEFIWKNEIYQYCNVAINCETQPCLTAFVEHTWESGFHVTWLGLAFFRFQSWLEFQVDFQYSICYLSMMLVLISSIGTAE